eukprot:gb/GECG01003055.1/.p1 GENE.gb/GECG01003055.1/~~gb/GECG01003055.1/.p1  ORF type:complete len:439 (+),score=47.74 gb/GECG01003055.1/:1-1317(+)
MAADERKSKECGMGKLEEQGTTYTGVINSSSESPIFNTTTAKSWDKVHVQNGKKGVDHDKGDLLSVPTPLDPEAGHTPSSLTLYGAEASSTFPCEDSVTIRQRNDVAFKGRRRFLSSFDNPEPTRQQTQEPWLDDMAETRSERRKFAPPREDTDKAQLTRGRRSSENDRGSSLRKPVWFSRCLICRITENDMPDNDTDSVLQRNETRSGRRRRKTHKYSSRQIVPILPPRNRSEPVSTKKKMLPIPRKTDNKPCLVLDLDETLVHSSFQRVKTADFVVTAKVDENPLSIYVIKRPFVHEFLKTLAQKYEIGIFTASQKEYAEKVVERLNADGTIQWTLYRESCTLYRGQRVKDLNRLPRQLSRTIIVDDRDTSFLFQPENGIECLPFYGNAEDVELKSLQGFLWEASDSEGLLDRLRMFDQYRDNVDNAVPNEIKRES